jgi:hypothetical protein
MTRTEPSVTESPPIYRWPRALAWLAALALAWVVPWAAYLAGVALIVPVLVVAGVMSLQRGTAGVFDRLVMSLAQLFAAVCVSGLLFSVWPWELHPVPMGGFALTLLVLISLVTGRRPTAPRRWRSRDGVLALVFGVVAVLTLEPFVLRDLGGRLGLLVTGEDMSRHFLIFDMTGIVGGYSFVHPHETTRFQPDTLAMGIRNYPQGVHLTMAVLDRFIRSADRNADTINMIDVMIWLHVSLFLFLTLCTLWAARRLAGPGVGPARLLPVLGLVGAWLYFGDPVTILVRAFPNQMVGLGLAAVLTAIVARPLADRNEQLVAVTLLLVGISFSYHLFLPYTLILAAIWAWRERLWRRPAAYVALVLMFGPLAITPVLNLYVTTGQYLTGPGTAQINDRPAAVVLIALAAVALFWRGGWRSPARRVNAVALGIATGSLALLGVYQLIILGRVIYYFEKTLHLVLIVALVSLGGLARLLPPGRPARGVVRRRAPGVAVVLPFVLFIVVAGGRYHTNVLHSPGFRLATGLEKGSPAGARDAMLMTRMYSDSGNAVSVDLMSTPYRNWYATTYASVLQHNYRYGHDWYVWYRVPQTKGWTIEDFEEMVAKSPVTVRLFVFDPKASFLVLDRKHPKRIQPDLNGPAYGERGALTNIEAAEHLKRKFPGKVEVVYATPPNP